MNEKTRKALLALAIVGIAVAIIIIRNPFEQQQPILPQTEGNLEEQSPYPTAPEIIGIRDWINSEELTLGGLRGKIVLVDFWTYSCVNCIRTLPYLKQWHEKYSSLGFVLIGVHSPEFEFEKKLKNVQMAVDQYGLKYPVALDSDMATWRNYKNRFWPAKYLVDQNGKIRYTHFGEGAYEETERMIQALLEETMQQNINIEITKEETQSGGAGFFRTRELYAGYAFGGYIGNEQGYTPQQASDFTDTQIHEDGKIYLHGKWFSGEEFVRHARTTQSLEDYIAINYLASEVNVVAGAGQQSYKVFVELDGKKLEKRYAGKDVQFDEQENAFVEVKESRLYNLILGPLGKRELRLSSNSDEFSLYTFTFGG